MKNIILIIIVLIFTCSKNDGLSPKDCLAYSVYVSDTCDCESYSCKLEYWTTEEEYYRLLNIYNESSEPCIYVYVHNFQGNVFEGYLLKLEILNIQPCLTD